MESNTVSKDDSNKPFLSKQGHSFYIVIIMKYLDFSDLVNLLLVNKNLKTVITSNYYSLFPNVYKNKISQFPPFWIKEELKEFMITDKNKKKKKFDYSKSFSDFKILLDKYNLYPKIEISFLYKFFITHIKYFEINLYDKITAKELNFYISLLSKAKYVQNFDKILINDKLSNTNFEKYNNNINKYLKMKIKNIDYFYSQFKKGVKKLSIIKEHQSLKTSEFVNKIINNFTEIQNCEYKYDCEEDNENPFECQPVRFTAHPFLYSDVLNNKYIMQLPKITSILNLSLSYTQVELSDMINIFKDNINLRNISMHFVEFINCDKLLKEFTDSIINLKFLEDIDIMYLKCENKILVLLFNFFYNLLFFDNSLQNIQYEINEVTNFKIYNKNSYNQHFVKKSFEFYINESFKYQKESNNEKSYLRVYNDSSFISQMKNLVYNVYSYSNNRCVHAHLTVDSLCNNLDINQVKYLYIEDYQFDYKYELPQILKYLVNIEEISFKFTSVYDNFEIPTILKNYDNIKKIKFNFEEGDELYEKLCEFYDNIKSLLEKKEVIFTYTDYENVREAYEKFIFETRITQNKNFKIEQNDYLDFFI